jgi:hypothetical protein
LLGYAEQALSSTRTKLGGKCQCGFEKVLLSP